MVATRYLAILLAVALNTTLSQRVDAAQRQAHMHVTATVLDPVRVRSVQHVQSVLVTPEDIARGFVEVPFGSRVALQASPHCTIELVANGSFFRSVIARSAYGSARLEANGPALRQRACGGAATDVDFNYRFELVPATQPGLYRWPVSAVVLPL